MAIKAKPVRPVRAALPQVETPLEESRRLLAEQERSLLIDTKNLDDEWEHHAERYWHAAKQASLAASYRDEAKSNLSKAEAAADQVARNAAETAARTAAARDPKHKAEKATEGQIKARVALDPAVAKAAKEVLQWTFLTNLWQGLVSSLHERRYALDGETRLYLANYYETSGARGGESELKDAVAEDVRRHGT